MLSWFSWDSKLLDWWTTKSDYWLQRKRNGKALQFFNVSCSKIIEDKFNHPNTNTQAEKYTQNSSVSYVVNALVVAAQEVVNGSPNAATD